MRFKVLIFFVGWGVFLSLGFYVLLAYEQRPGEPGKPPESWPKQTSFQPTQGLPTLLMFLHPRCPCSQASLEELAKLLPHIGDKINLYLIFYKPKEFSANWVRSSLWEQAHKMSGAQVLIDSDLAEISLFKPKTSGQVYLYSERAELIYSGGLTASRGHAGDNEGRRGVFNYVIHHQRPRKKFSVFGCSLFHEGETL